MHTALYTATLVAMDRSLLMKTRLSRRPKAAEACRILESISESRRQLLETMLPRYVKCSTRASSSVPTTHYSRAQYPEPSTYSVLIVRNSRPTPYSIAISDLKSTLYALTRLFSVKKRRAEGHLRYLGGVFANAVTFVSNYVRNSEKILNDVNTFHHE